MMEHIQVLMELNMDMEVLMAKVPVYHSIDYEEKKIYIDIEEIKNEALREIKKDYPDWDEDDFEVVEVT